MTQKQLAKRAGLSQPTISDLENNKVVSIEADTLLRVCAVLEAHPVYLWHGIGPKNLAMTPDAAKLMSVYVSLPPERQAALIAAGEALALTVKPTT